MDSLAECLARFNRAEPDLVFRDAFGHQEKELRVSDDFRGRVREAAGIKEAIPKDVWWAAEMPINALAGAIALYVEGDRCIVRRGKQLKKRTYPNDPPLIKGGRPDFDFVMSYHAQLSAQLVLLEAKAYSPNDIPQIGKKLEYLEALYGFYQSLENYHARPIQFSFLLVCPPWRRMLLEPHLKELTALWPAWACRSIPPLMELKIDRRSGILKTTSRGDKGRWRIVRS